MFRNLAVLLASGVLLNPVVLLGVASGLVIGIMLDWNQIVALYKNWRFKKNRFNEQGRIRRYRFAIFKHYY